MALYNLWYHKDSDTIYAINADECKTISEKIGSLCQCQPLPEVTKKEKGAYGIYRKKIIGKLYPFRIAFYEGDYIATYDILKHQANPQEYEKEFSQESFLTYTQDKLDSRLKFSPILHYIQTLTWDVFENGQCSAERFFRIVDSSIWNYFVANKNDFDKVINEIYFNWVHDYYSLSIAKEYADLNARLTQQSFLHCESNDNTEESGHGAAVSPFLFHSEQDIATQRKEEYEKKLEGKVYDFKKYKWRVLLVDDKIGNNYLTPSNLEVSKESIIENRIKGILWEGCYCKCVYDLKDYNDELVLKYNVIIPDMLILCVDSKEKAKTALRNYKFDFILLDYLLEKHKDKDSKEIERHYGYELLTDLDKDAIGKDCSDLTPYLHYDEGKRYIVGPDHRYFFMFISAFTTAISERLRLLGYSRSEELWHIAEGACPTNTPELFCYNLQKMMVKRIKDSGMEKLNPDKILELTEKIFRKATEGKESVRKRANENYSDVLGLLYHYNRILNDVEIPRDEKLIFSIRESVLMTSFMKDHENFGGLLEHLVHLVHLTAFGTARQWSEMWEEFLYFKNQFTDLFNGRLDKSITLMIDDKEQTIPIRAALSMLYGSIEDHILELKKIN